MHSICTSLIISTAFVCNAPTAIESRPADSDSISRPSRRLQPAEVPDLGTRTRGVDWPDFLGPRRDSKSPETGIMTRWPPQGPPLIWKKRLGTGYGIGSVSRGRFFQFDRHGQQARLTCMHSETGEELWRFEYPTDYVDMYQYNNGPRCSPVIEHDRVYIFGAEGMLHCVRVTDGEPIWKVDTSSRYHVVQNFFGVGSTPLIEGNLLMVMVGGSPPGTLSLKESQGGVPGNGSGIVAFDKFTGKEKYRISDELASYAGLISATIGGERFCFGFCREGLLGFEPTTGKIDFRFPWRARVTESVNASTPIIFGNRVFISETYGPGSALLAIRRGGHQVIWSDDRASRIKRMQTHWNTAIYHNGHIYGSSGRHHHNAELRCLRADSGEVRWSQPGLYRSSLLYVDGHFICLSEDGTLRLIKVNAEKYEPIAEVLIKHEGHQLLEYPAWAAPILSHGLLYVRGKEFLVCLELIGTDPTDQIDQTDPTDQHEEPF